MGPLNDRERKNRGFKEVLLGLFLLGLALYGLIMFCISVHNYFKPEDFPVTIHGTYEPKLPGRVYDFSGMEMTLRGIERQLEIMNKIHEAEKGGDLKWEK